MPPAAILDPSSLDLNHVVADRGQIEGVNPHRFEFCLLDAVVHADAAKLVYAGYYDVRDDAWWARGHIPGRPIMPGVLMIESAAQLASYGMHQMIRTDAFIGLLGVDGAKFRDAVVAPARLVTVARAQPPKRGRCTFDCQGFVGDRMVFEASITGVAL